MFELHLQSEIQIGFGYPELSSEVGSDAEDSQAEASSGLAPRATQATSHSSSKKGKGTGTGKQASNKVTTMSDAIEDLPGRESDADSGGTLCERMGTKGNIAESKRIREFSLFYCMSLALLMA